MKNNFFFGFIRNMKLQYKIGSGFLLCALLFLGNYGIIKYVQNLESKESSTIINIAGRNRMLSQKITIECQTLFRGNEQIRTSLINDIELHESSLKVLKNGGKATNNNDVILPPAPNEVLPSIIEVEDFWKEFKKNAEIILSTGNVREAKEFISKNYSEMLNRNNELVRAFSKSFSENKNFDSKINTTITDMAGRNRMLSQRIGLICMRKFCEQVTDEDEKNLENAIALHHKSLDILKNGGLSPAIEPAYIIPPANTEVLPIIIKVEELWLKYKENSETILNEKEAIKAIGFIEMSYLKLLGHNENLVNVYSNFLEKQKKENVSQLNFYLLLILIFNLIISVGAIWLTLRLISKPITNLVKVVNFVSEGDLSQHINYNINDEIGMASMSVDKLIENQKRASNFAVNIGDGKFNDEFTPLSEKDTLGNSLITMRNNLQLASEIEEKRKSEDVKRNWATEGMAIFGEILRSTNDDLKKLTEQIINKLVKYLSANQGSLFIVQNNETDEKVLELYSCYAWDRKKFTNKKITLGEGLVGQAWQEGETILMTDIPSDYIRITSGLGDANPTCIIIVPIKVNDEIFGIIELATLYNFEPNQKEFLEKIGESIASTISSVKINLKTAELLAKSQQQTGILLQQEEEMRQNLEELHATQDEASKREADISGIINAIDNTISKAELQINGNIININAKFYKVFEIDKINLNSLNIKNFIYENQYDIFDEGFKTVSTGVNSEFTVKGKTYKNNDKWLLCSLTPVYDANKQVDKVLFLANDITIQKETENELTLKHQEMQRKEEELNQNLEETKAQEEELRQNMEEMFAQQEEMQRLHEESEAQIRTMNTLAIVSKTDVKGNITYVNEEFLKWSKYSREELMGNNHRILKSGHQPDSIFVEMWKTISKGEVFRGEVKNKAKDGSYYWVDATVAPILGSNGKPKEYIALRYVINDRKIKEKEIEGLMSVVNHGAIVSKTDLRGYITYANEEFCRIAKYSHDELIGKNHNIVRHPDMPKEAFANLWETIGSGKVWRGQVKNKAKDGSHYWVDATIAPILGENGKPIEYVAVRYLITDYKKQEEELLAIKKELEIIKEKR